MNIIFIAVGKSKGYLGEDIVKDYASRISHYSNFEWKIIPTSEVREENEKIMKAIPAAAFLVLLDEKGKETTSKGLAEFLQKRQNDSTKNLVFVIGGAYGFTDELREKADFTWSLSPLTFPHELVRSILSEQIYRAFTIIKGEKYHHD